MGSGAHTSKNPFVAAVFWTTLVFLYIPLVYLVVQTFLVNPQSWASGFTLEWLLRLWNSNTLWEPLFNSLQIGICSATIAVTLGTLGAVGLTPVVDKLPSSIQTLIMLPILLPEVITGLSLLLFFLLVESVLNWVGFKEFGLGMFTVILAHSSFSASFAYFIMVEQVKKLDPQMGEAALDLGAKPTEIFWKVTLPNILPGVMGAWLLAFTISFDDFLISFFTSGAGVNTLPLKIYSLLKIGVSPEINALSFVMIAFSSLLVLALVSRESSRKWVVKG
jgi:ABC-type spermidine/putrescine transport system permease subunit II